MRLIGLIAAVGMLAGCAAYFNYPPQKGDTALHRLDWRPAEDVMVVAFRWAIENYPPGWGAPGEADEFDAVAVSVPEGANPYMYERVVRECSSRAVPALTDNRELPTYLVGRLIIRGVRAEADVFRPVPAVDGGWAYQPITVYIRNERGIWRVTSSRPWSVGTMEPPAVNCFDSPPPAPEAEAQEAEPGAQEPEGEPQEEGEPEGEPDAGGG